LGLKRHSYFSVHGTNTLTSRHCTHTHTHTHKTNYKRNSQTRRHTKQNSTQCRYNRKMAWPRDWLSHAHEPGARKRQLATPSNSSTRKWLSLVLSRFTLTPLAWKRQIS